MTSQQGIEELNKKLKLEKRLKPKLRKFFKQIGRDANVFISATRTVPNLSPYKLDLIAILREHYRLVINAFKSDLRDSSKSFNPAYFKQSLISQVQTSVEVGLIDEGQADQQILQIDSDFINFVNGHSEQQAAFILNTTQKDLDKISTAVIVAALAGGAIISPSEVGDQVQRGFNQTIEGRVDTISITETQTPAEETKLTEALALAGILALSTGVQRAVTKTWNSVFLPTTRFSHAEAHGQIVGIDSPFVVQQQLLMAPGDASLGASIDNIINCHCFTTFSV